MGGRNYQLNVLDCIEGGQPITRYLGTTELYNMVKYEQMELIDKGIVYCIHGGKHMPKQVYAIS